MHAYSGVETNIYKLAAMLPEQLARNYVKRLRADMLVYHRPCTYRGFSISHGEGMHGVKGVEVVTTKGRKAKILVNGVDTGHVFDLNNKADYSRLYCALGEHIDK